MQRNRLLTDRSAYISHLETQLERVTTACLVADGISENFTDVQRQTVSLQEKMFKYS